MSFISLENIFFRIQEAIKCYKICQGILEFVTTFSGLFVISQILTRITEQKNNVIRNILQKWIIKYLKLKQKILSWTYCC